MLQVRRAGWYGEIAKILLPSEVPFTSTLPQKWRMRICYSLWCQRHTGLPPWMGVIEKQDIKAVTVLYPYYKNASGGQGWPSRWDKLLRPVNAASSMRVASQGPFMPYSGKKRLGRWCTKSQLTSPPTKWQTNTVGHESSTETGFFSSHQRLAFPCVMATIIHRTGVPVPPHARLPP